MKRIVASIVCFWTVFGFSQTLSEKLAPVVEQFAKDTNLAAASIGVCVKDLTTNQIIYNYNADKNFVPASLQKLPLTAIALQKLGSNYTFKTYLLISGNIKDSVLQGDVYIIGGGDPTLGCTRFKETFPDTIFAKWQKALLNKGIHSIEGNLFLDPSIFEPHSLNETWMWGDVGNYFGAGARGLNWHENMFVIAMNPADSINKKGQIKDIYPSLPKDYIINNEVITTTKGTESYIMIYGDSYGKQREISGNISIDKSNLTAKGAMPFPEYVCAVSFKEYLEKQGIAIKGKIMYTDIDTLQKTFDTISIHQSPYLSVIVNHIHKTSNNVYAEAVFKLMGKGISTKASQEIKEGMKRMGIQTENINVADGCGLSTANLISPHALCDVLSYVYSMPFYNSYLLSLSEAGVSGTMKNILKNKPKGSNIYAKSGTMTGIRAYAGYAVNEKGAIYSFALIVNNFTCSSSVIREKLETILSLLME